MTRVLLVAVFMLATISLPALAAEKTIALTILDAETGKPIPGATATLRERAEYKIAHPADDEGRVTISTGKTPQYVSILFRKDGYVTTAATWTHPDDTPAETPEQFTMKLAKGRSIGGRVADKEGKPVAGATVTLSYWPDSPRDGESTTADNPRIKQIIPWEKRKTDADGRWSYGGADPAAPQIEVHVDHPDFVRQEMEHDRDLGIQSLFDGSAQTTLDPGVELPVIVKSADGKPIPGAKVTTVQTFYVVNDYGTTRKSDADGKTTLPHQAAKPKTLLTVAAKGFCPEMREIDVTAGMKPEEFALLPGKLLHGKVVDADGNPIKDVSVMWRGWGNHAPIGWTGKTDAEGRFQMPDAPPGSNLCFHFSKKGYAYLIKQDVKAPGDESAEVTISLQTEKTGPGL